MGHGPGALLLLRHGESTANAAELFTGVLDAPLTAHGREQAAAAAALIVRTGLMVRAVYSSELVRAKTTAQIIAEIMSVTPVRRDWRLNERSYGALTGQSKSQILDQYGPEQFTQWRRSVSSAPPPMPDTLYAQLASTGPFNHLPARALQRTESLREVISRVAGVYDAQLSPYLRYGHTIVVVAHGNSLRALCAVLDQLSDPDIETLNIPTGQPLLYTFTRTMTPLIPGGQYLDQSHALAAAAEVAQQGGT